MPTFLELCQDVRLMSGAQGVGPLKVTELSGYEQALVKFVKDAYIDIQSTREDFRFLRSNTVFNTVIGQQEYTTTKTDIRSFVNRTLKVKENGGNYQHIRSINYDVAEHRFLDEDATGFPQYYTITPSDEIKLYPKPDKVYTASIDYQENPEILSADTQVPKIPLSFHILISYKALQKFCVFMGIPDVYREYSQEAARLTQKLMSLQVPQKRAKAPRFIV